MTQSSLSRTRGFAGGDGGAGNEIVDVAADSAEIGDGSRASPHERQKTEPARFTPPQALQVTGFPLGRGCRRVRDGLVAAKSPSVGCSESTSLSNASAKRATSSTGTAIASAGAASIGSAEEAPIGSADGDWSTGAVGGLVLVLLRVRGFRCFGGAAFTSSSGTATWT
ncbi:MAG: hypothetical protein ACLQK4_13385 [Acidimicrobiales bacterium]